MNNDAPISDQVFEALSAGPLTKKQIAEATGLAIHWQINNSLKYLRDQNRVQVCDADIETGERVYRRTE